MTYPLYSDEFFMNEALKEAKKAFDKDEVPIGAVIVAGNIIIARGYNMTENLGDVTAHAEMIAITSAENYLGSKYLNDCVLYVTLEPCLMCVGAMFHARIARVVYGASDPKTGAAGSVLNLFEEQRLNHHATVEGGVLAGECGNVLSEFFAARRAQQRA